ncbi:TonB-dependent receptor domain-containing protein [Moraxella cuniculi]|uniref:Heme/hemopexin utilization protein C n=1 Tax=Moraxella cuniculi TaxID=34061 RepID=A0A448GYI7_9GAMM|nr:TonB-dependent receptor [Moraxella cuniculi]VEG13904.1 Heme/hemopexin utilization protein C precursor [Moraxella cuniculi]
MKKLQLLPLSVAVATVCYGTAFAATKTTPPATANVVLATDYVTADRQGAKVKTNVVTTAQKNESTETDLRGLLNQEPAIEFAGGNGTSQYVAIRGMGQNSIDIKVDNGYSDAQVLYHQSRFILDPSLVKIVSVQKGAGSASAGIGATNGAIIAKTLDAADLLKGSDKNYGVKLNAGYASNGKTASYGVTAFGKADNFDLLLSANRADDDENYKAGKDYKNPVDGSSVITYSALDKQAFLAKAGLNLGNHRLVLSQTREITKGMRTVREEFPDFGGTDTRQSPSYREMSKDQTNLEWTTKNLGFADITANAYLIKNERYSADDSGCGYCGNIQGPTTTTITTKGANINFDSQVGESTLVKYGVNYRYQEAQPPFYSKATDRINVAGRGQPRQMVELGADVRNAEKTDTGAYFEAISDVGPVTVTAGVRYDHFTYKAMDGKTVSDGAINPSLGLIWQATPSLSLNANHNYATRSPRLYDAVMSHGRRGIISIADGTKAERARNTEVGFNLNHTFANEGKLTLDGSYFWQKIDDAVVNPQNRHDAKQIRNIANVGYITNQGYEVGVGYRQGGLTARVSVSDNDPKFHGLPDIEGDLNPDFAFNIGRTVTSSLSYRFKNPNLEVGVRNRDVTTTVGAVNDNSVANPIRPSYNKTDLFANWKPYGTDKLNVNFAINNVADKYYLPHSQRANSGVPAQGRDYRVGVNFTF